MSRKVKPKRQSAIYLLAIGQSNIEVANALKIRPETLSRWKRQPDFSAAVEKAAGEFAHNIKSRLVALVDNSIRTIDAQLDNNEDSLSDRVELGWSILEMFNIANHFPDDLISPVKMPPPQDKTS